MTGKADAVEAAREAEHDLERRYRDVLERGLQLARACGLRPWETPLSSSAYRNPYKRGSSQYAALEQVRTEAVKLETERLELRGALERARRARLDAEHDTQAVVLKFPPRVRA